MKGKLYFSDMFFANPAAGDWTGSPARSRLIVMTPDGKWRVLSTGMQSNGTLAAKNGNLIVCDMFGHRVVEVDPATGRVVRVVLDKVNGKPIDGPNDLVMDAKGGLYITDPQFTPESTKSQPGKQVYYVAPDGTARVVIGPGEYAMPNGVELSPDGKTLYVNNTWQQPGENFVWAYDVAADGSLSNKRQFAMLNLTPGVLERGQSGRPRRFRRRWHRGGHRWPLLCGHQERRADISSRRHVCGHDLGAAVSGQRHIRRREQRRALHGGGVISVGRSRRKCAGSVTPKA